MYQSNAFGENGTASLIWTPCADALRKSVLKREWVLPTEFGENSCSGLLAKVARVDNRVTIHKKITMSIFHSIS